MTFILGHLTHSTGKDCIMAVEKQCLTPDRQCLLDYRGVFVQSSEVIVDSDLVHQFLSIIDKVQVNFLLDHFIM